MRLFSVCEGVEKAATRLKEEVLGGLCVESIGKERIVREAAEVVLKRKEAVRNQLLTHKETLKAARQGLLKAVNDRFDALEAELEAAAVEKQEALIEQSKGLEAGALGLKQAKEGAEQTLESLVVEERPVEIVEACLKLKQELAAINQASQASAPVREANLHVAVASEKLDAIKGEVKGLGWAGALDVDVARSSFNKQGDELFVGPGGHFDIILTTRDKLGQQLKAGGLDVKATVKPEARVDGSVAVEDMGDGAYGISFNARKVEGPEGDRADFQLNVQLCGKVLHQCPVSISWFPSLILTQSERIKGVHDLLSGKRLELCYRASRDGWNAADFHRLCDNRGPTLVVAREQANRNIFGGYAGVAWYQPNDLFIHDGSAFLFTFKPGEMAPVKLPVTRPSHALYGHSASGPAFGGGRDLEICSNANTHGGSYSNLGPSYHLPNGADVKTYLAGSTYFLLSELEVFLIM
jgi:hypothetical protein